MRTCEEFRKIIQNWRGSNRGAKKYVRYEEGAYLYSMGRKNFTDLAKEAGAVRKIGGVCLVSIEKLNKYIEEQMS